MSAPQDDTAGTAVPSRVRRSRRRWLIAGGAIVALAVAGVWTSRRPIAASLIDRQLHAWGVPVLYAIEDVGVREQRLRHVVIGDPAHPDLVADWVRVETRIGWNGAQVLAVRAGRVRLRGKLVDGRLALGAIDKLLPAPSGKPFALPAVELSVDDARMRLETPQGVVGLRLTGSGRLDNGFSGSLAAVSDRLGSGDCAADHVAAVVRVSVSDGQPRLAGPVRAAALACNGVVARQLTADQTTVLSEALDRWQGEARLQAARLQRLGVTADGASGTVSYSGSAKRTEGKATLAAKRVATADGVASNAQFDGGYAIGSAAVQANGHIAARVELASRWRQQLLNLGKSAAGTPVAPLLGRAGQAAAAASQAIDIGGDASLADGRLTVTALQAQAPTGAVATLGGGAGLVIDGNGPIRLDGLATLSGGGLPGVALQLRPLPGGGLRGTGVVQPYAAGAARLALDTLDIRVPAHGAVAISADARLSGPLADGRVDDLRLPIEARWDRGVLAVNPRCAPVSAASLKLASLTLDRPRLTLCPDGGAMVRLAGNKLSGGVRTGAVTLSGRLSENPLQLEANSARLGLADRRFTLAGVAATLGTGDDPTRLRLTTLDGRIEGATIAGGFTRGAGKIANVPLLMTEAQGDWRFADGRLTVNGTLAVADAAAKPRFLPVDATDVALTLADNRITVAGRLVHPGNGARLSDVAIVHDLSSGVGAADLKVAGVEFGPALQPDDLTDATRGVIADVKARVTGDGHIRWTRDGVTSDGVFATRDADFAAAFGPVRGLTTEIHFTDLLNLESAPDQRATVALINPGVVVENGSVRFRLLRGERVDVATAEWPFAGGRLVLQPTLLDFTQDHERHLTFAVTGVDAALFLQQLDFKNLNATGVFDGTLPMIFSDRGGRIEEGQLVARPGGGSISYVGEVSQKDLGFWGNMAFQSLRSLNYRRLTVTMNGPLEGEVITDVRFAGLSQGAGTKSNFLIRRLAKLPLVFNVRITAPFRQLFGSVQDYYDPSRLIQRHLPELQRVQEEADRQRLSNPAQPVQPNESETPQ